MHHMIDSDDWMNYTNDDASMAMHSCIIIVVDWAYSEAVSMFHTGTITTDIIGIVFQADLECKNTFSIVKSLNSLCFHYLMLVRSTREHCRVSAYLSQQQTSHPLITMSPAREHRRVSAYLLQKRRKSVNVYRSDITLNIFLYATTDIQRQHKSWWQWDFQREYNAWWQWRLHIWESEQRSYESGERICVCIISKSLSIFSWSCIGYPKSWHAFILSDWIPWAGSSINHPLNWNWSAHE